MNTLLMVPPTYYGVEYEINPWMDRQRPACAATAREQWEGLYQLLIGALGATVLLAKPEVGLPDMVFTANAGLVCGQRVVLSNFRPVERRGEALPFRRWFVERGLEVVELPEALHFEGEGDALFVDETLFAGYRWRSDVRAHQRIERALGVRVLSLELVDPRFYHLDTCFCPLDARTAIYFPAAFDDYSRRVLEENVPRLIEVHPEEAVRFACNAVVMGLRVALNAGCPRLEASLHELGYTPHATPLDEFIKAGGSAKCLVLHLDRHGAARDSQHSASEASSYLPLRGFRR